MDGHQSLPKPKLQIGKQTKSQEKLLECLSVPVKVSVRESFQCFSFRKEVWYSFAHMGNRVRIPGLQDLGAPKQFNHQITKVFGLWSSKRATHNGLCGAVPFLDRTTGCAFTTEPEKTPLVASCGA